jgi:hypothetical protein
MKEPTAKFTVQCWGCDKSVTLPYESFEDHQHKIEVLKVQGWRRVLFGPGAEPWFCSEDCALYSYNARKAKEWWGNHFVNQYRNRRLKWMIIFSAIFVIGGWLLMSAMR